MGRYFTVTNNVLYKTADKTIYVSPLPMTKENLNHWNKTIAPNDIILFFPTRTVKNELLTIYSNLFRKNAIVICNEPEEKTLCNNLSIYSTHINCCAFLNENQYKNDPTTSKKYETLIVLEDVTEDSQLHLTQNLKNFAILCNNPQDISLPSECRDECEFLTFDKPISEIYNSAKSTLCLSLDSSKNYQSSESLLCGIPVVSVPSFGGRHLWYNPINSIIADSTPESIAESVWDCNRRRFNPEQIRYKHISMMKTFREKFCKTLQIILHLNYTEAQSLFATNFENKLFEWSNSPQPESEPLLSE